MVVSCYHFIFKYLENSYKIHTIKPETLQAIMFFTNVSLYEWLGGVKYTDTHSMKDSDSKGIVPI